MFEVYIIQSLKTGRYYIGHASNVHHRSQEHNNGKVKSTKFYKPWKLVYRKQYKTKQDAYRREQQIKSYKSGEAFKSLIKKVG